MLSSSFALGVVVCLLLLSSCSAQCTGSVYTPNTTAPPDRIYGQSGNDSYLWLMPVQLTQPAVVTGLSIFPWNASGGGTQPLQGSLSVTGALYAGLSLISQSEVVTVTDFSAFNNAYPVPLPLVFLQSASVAAGNYSVLYWYSWVGVGSSVFRQFGSQSLPTLYQMKPQQFNLTDFNTEAGRLPAQLPAFSPILTVWPGVLVSVQYEWQCYGSSSTGNGAAQSATGLTALPLFVVALAAVYSLLS